MAQADRLLGADHLGRVELEGGQLDGRDAGGDDDAGLRGLEGPTAPPAVATLTVRGPVMVAVPPF